MDLIQRIKARFSNPRPRNEYISSNRFSFGRTTSGKSVNEKSAMKKIGEKIDGLIAIIMDLDGQ